MLLHEPREPRFATILKRTRAVFATAKDKANEQCDDDVENCFLASCAAERRANRCPRRRNHEVTPAVRASGLSAMFGDAVCSRKRISNKFSHVFYK